MNSNPNRQPPGTPTGGQFAPDPWAANAAPIALDGDTERWPESGAELETLVTSGLDRDWAEDGEVTSCELFRQNDDEVGLVHINRPGASMGVVLRRNDRQPVRVETEVFITTQLPGKFLDDPYLAGQHTLTQAANTIRLKRVPAMIGEAIAKDRMQHEVNNELLWPGLEEAKAQHIHGPHPWLRRPVHVDVVEAGAEPSFIFRPAPDWALGETSFEDITVETRRTDAGNLKIARVLTGEGTVETDDRKRLAQVWADVEAWSLGKEPPVVHADEEVAVQERRMLIRLTRISEHSNR